MIAGVDLSAHVARVRATAPCVPEGQVADIVGLIVEVAGVRAATGERLEVRATDGSTLALEVLGFRGGRLLAAPLGPTAGIQPGARVVKMLHGASAEVGDALLGRVLDAFGRPLDDKPPPVLDRRAPLQREPPSPFKRQPIHTALDTGVRVLDTLLPLGRGQRVGLFAGTGVGKSTLLGMLCRRARTDSSMATSY